MAPPSPRRQIGQILENHPFRQKSSIAEEENCSIKSGRILTDGVRELDLCYFASDNYLRLLSSKTGDELASCAFSDKAIIADAAYCCIDEVYDGLVIGVNDGDKSAICFLDIKSSRVLKAIKIKQQVTRVETIADGSGDAALRRSVLHRMFADCRQVVAVGTVGGHVYLLDMAIEQRTMHSDNTVATALDPKGYYDLLSKFHNEDEFLFNNRPLDLDLVSVMCLRFCEKASLLGVGFEFGGVGLFSLSQPTIKLLFFNCPGPALHMTFQEPENDPKPYLYLWIGHENSEQTLSKMQLTQIGFKEKRVHEILGTIYSEMESMRDVLTWQPPDCERIISLTTIAVSAKQWTSNRMDDSVEGVATDGVDTGHVLIGWMDSKRQVRGAVFDLNGWYNKRMANIVRFDRTGQCPFLSIFHFNNADIDAADVLHLVALSHTVHRFQMGSTEIADQLYYPSALRFTAIVLTDNSVINTTISSLQDQVISDLESSYATVIDNPSGFYRELSDVGLIQPRTTTVSSTNKERQWHAVLSTLLCLHRTPTLGRLAAVDALKKKMSDWLWTEVGGAKKRMDEIASSLFSVGGIGLSRTGRLALSHQVYLFESSESIMKKLLEGNHSAETEAEELRCRLAAIQALAFYGQLVSFMTDYGLLPETSQLREVIVKIRRDVRKRREAAQTARRSLWMDDLIDEMQSTSGTASAWSRLSPEEWYPPPSILNLLSPVLLLEVSKQSKLNLLGYFLLDIAAAAEGTSVNIGPLFDRFCAHVLFGASSLKRSISYYWQLDAGIRAPSPISWDPPKFVPSPSEEEANKPEWRKLYEKPLLRLSADEEKRLKELILKQPSGAHLWNMWLVEKYRFDELHPVKPKPADGPIEAACSAVVQDIQRRMPKVPPRASLPHFGAIQHAPPGVASKKPEILPRELALKKKIASHLERFSMQHKPSNATFSPLRRLDLKRDAAAASSSSQLTEQEQSSEDETPVTALTPKRSRMEHSLFKSPAVAPHSSKRINDTVLDTSRFLDIRSLLQTPPVVASVRHTPSSMLAPNSAAPTAPHSILKSHKKLVLNWNDGDGGPSLDKHLRFDLPDSPALEESSSSLLSMDKSSESFSTVPSTANEMERPPRPVTPPPREAQMALAGNGEAREYACEEQELDDEPEMEGQEQDDHQSSIVYSLTDDSEIVFNFSAPSSSSQLLDENDDEMPEEQGERVEKQHEESFHDAVEDHQQAPAKASDDSPNAELSADELDNSMDVEEFVVRSSPPTAINPPPSNALSALRRQYTGAADESTMSVAMGTPTSSAASFRRVTRSISRTETSSIVASAVTKRTTPPYDVKERSFEEQEDPFATQHGSSNVLPTESVPQPTSTDAERIVPILDEAANEQYSFSGETIVIESQLFFSSPSKKIGTPIVIPSKFVFSPPHQRMPAATSAKARRSAEADVSANQQRQITPARFSFSSPKRRSSVASSLSPQRVEDPKRPVSAKSTVVDNADRMEVVEQSDRTQDRATTPEPADRSLASPRRSARSSTVATAQQNQSMSTTPPSTPKTPRSPARKPKQQAQLDDVPEEKGDDVQPAKTVARTPRSARKLQLDAVEEEKEPAKKPSAPPAVDEASKESSSLEKVPSRQPSRIRAGRRSLLDPSVEVPTPEHHRRMVKSKLVGGRRKTVSASEPDDSAKSAQVSSSPPARPARLRRHTTVGNTDAESSFGANTPSSSPSRLSAADRGKRAAVLKAPMTDMTIPEESDSMEARKSNRTNVPAVEPESSSVADRLLTSPRRATRSSTIVTADEQPTTTPPSTPPRSTAKKSKQQSQLDDIEEENDEELQPAKKVARTPRSARKLQLDAIEEEREETAKAVVKSPKSAKKLAKVDEQLEESVTVEKVPSRRPSNIRAGRRSVIDPSVDVPTPVMIRQAKSMAERRRTTLGAAARSSDSTSTMNSSAAPALRRSASTSSSSSSTAAVSNSPSRRSKRSTMLKEPQSETIAEEGEEDGGDVGRIERMRTPDLDGDVQPSNATDHKSSLRRSARKTTK